MDRRPVTLSGFGPGQHLGFDRSRLTLFRHHIVITLAIWFCPLCRHRLIIALMPEQRPGDPRCLVGHSDEDDIGWPTGEKLIGPTGICFWSRAVPTQHSSGAVHKQTPDIPISPLRYSSQLGLAPARLLSGNKTEPGRELPS